MPELHVLDRRSFVRRSAGFALLPAVRLETIASIGAAPRARVAIVRTADRRRGVTDALRLLDLRAIRGKRVVLKPNFNSADDAPASTHNDTLLQLIAELHDRGARNITLGESSGPPRTQGV